MLSVPCVQTQSHAKHRGKSMQGGYEVALWRTKPLFHLAQYSLRDTEMLRRKPGIFCVADRDSISGLYGKWLLMEAACKQGHLCIYCKDLFLQSNNLQSCLQNHHSGYILHEQNIRHFVWQVMDWPINPWDELENLTQLSALGSAYLLYSVRYL